jgi:hypothetical protein
MLVHRDLHSKCLEAGTCNAKGLEKILSGLGKDPSRSWKDCIAANGFGPKDLSCTANGLGKGHVHR